MKRALVLTNHLHAWAGSEILSLDVSEALSKTYKVSLVANVVANEIYTLCQKHGIAVSNKPHELDLREFDFIWAQHLVAPLCKGFSDLDNFSGSFNSVHLSPFEPFELASLIYTKHLGANLVCNSKETLKKIESFYVETSKIYNFYNATTDDFLQKEPLTTDNSKEIGSVLIVSNHVPQELVIAADNLTKQGIRVAAFGRGQKNYKRLSKNDIQAFDAVVSIGKTVQNAILSRRPIYCYDQFGGPGYITSTNFQTALDFNFSGRCCYRKLTPNQLSDEIITSYDFALRGTNDLFNVGRELFNLKNFLAKLALKNTKLTTQSIDVNPIIENSKLIRREYIGKLQIS